VSDVLVQVGFEGSIAAGGIGVEPTAGLDSEVRGLLHGLHGEIAGRLDDDSPLATDPGDDGWPIFVVMATAWLALLTATTGSAAQVLFSSVLRLPLVSSRMVEVVRFDRPLQLAVHLIGQRGIAQPPAPAIAGPDMHAYLSGDAS